MASKTSYESPATYTLILSLRLINITKFMPNSFQCVIFGTGKTDVES